MLALWPIITSVSQAHEGDAHGPPSVSPDGLRLPTTGSHVEAVLVVPSSPHAGGEAQLLVADAETSEPIGDVAATLSLSGPAEHTITFSATAEGIASAPWPELDAGAWSGPLVLQAPVVDLLAIGSLQLDDPPAPPGQGIPWIPATALLVGLLLGWALGRARVVVAATALLLLPSRPRAHGDDAPTAAASTGAALILPLDGQFLVGLRTGRSTLDRLQPTTRGWGRLIAPTDGRATVRAPLPGSLRLHPGLRPGDLLAAGQALGDLTELPTAAERLSIVATAADARARLAEARRALTLAERDADHIGALGESLSERERVDRQQTLPAARAALASAEDTLQAAATSRVHVLRAPLSGHLSALRVRDGEVVEAGEDLLTIVGAGPLWVEVHVPASVRTQVGAEATVYLDRVALAAHVLDPGREVDPQTGTLRLVLTLDEAATQDLLPGTAITALIPDGSPRTAVLVPDEALVDTPGGTLVFLKTGPETFAARTVVVGARAGGQREIVAGLQRGERVVIRQAPVLRSLAGR